MYCIFIFTSKYQLWQYKCKYCLDTRNTLVNIINCFLRSRPTSVNKSEIQHFEKQAANWWHPNASVKLLRAMNSVRVPLVKDGLIDIETARKEWADTATPLTGLKVLDVGCGGMPS